MQKLFRSAFGELSAVSIRICQKTTSGRPTGIAMKKNLIKISVFQLIHKSINFVKFKSSQSNLIYKQRPLVCPCFFYSLTEALQKLSEGVEFMMSKILWMNLLVYLGSTVNKNQCFVRRELEAKVEETWSREIAN